MSLRRKLPSFVVLVAAGLGLGVSTLLLIEYASPDPKFCGEGGGCEAVRFSAYSYLGPIPVPVLGIGFFAALIGAYFKARKWLMPIAVAGAVAAAAFIYLQAAVIQAVCPFCVVADGAALLACAGAIILMYQSPTVEVGRAGMWAATLALMATAGYGMATVQGAAEHGALPEVIASEQREGVVTVVEFLDFQCPYCRKQHAEMKPVLDEYGAQVRVVYKHVPLAGHKHALGAASAAICAGEQDAVAKMADALLTREDITPLGCEQVAEQLGLDMEAFRACVASERPKAVIEADRETATAAAVRGLPTFFIGKRRFEGLQKASTVRAAIERAR